MRVFSIILADDEPNILYGMQKGIDWESLGFSVVGTAQNGKEVLDMMDEFHPDLVISDIKMPFMDGLELAKNIHENYMNTKVILFSGWDDFTYARLAISYGVSEYVMKPIDYEEMQRLLIKMYQELEKEYNEKINRVRLENAYTQSLPLLRQQFFSRLMTEVMEEKECRRQIKNLKLDLSDQVYSVIAVKVGKEGKKDILSELSMKETLKEALEKIAPVLLYPVFGILIVGLVMTFVVEPPIGALNTALNTALTNMSGSSKVLLGIIVAGMMAVDMGGPFNKAAYVFGTASIAAGNYGIMAAVMIGGMVPPCAIALASLLFKDKFTKTERESAPTNFIMGLAFITEGAIPFAASDPLHVIPACVIGSGLAGALSMAFNCTLMAPHGGIFVFPVVGNPLMYLAALAVGTVVGALMLGVLKKKIAE